MSNIKTVEEFYKNLWEDYAARKAEGYFEDRFDTRSAIGLRNFVREAAIFEIMRLKPHETFLDVGCASGRQVFQAAKVCKRGVGTDIAKNFTDKATAHAQERGIKNVEFFPAPMEKLPFPDESFDVILCAEVLEHPLNPKPGLQEISRVLKRNGRLVVSVPNENGDGTYWKRLKNFILRRKFKPLTEFDLATVEQHGDAHVRIFNKNTISEFLDEYGFHVYEKVRGASMLDSPFFDIAVDVLGHITFIKKSFVALELFLSGHPVFTRWGRQLVVVANKKAD